MVEAMSDIIKREYVRNLFIIIILVWNVNTMLNSDLVR